MNNINVQTEANVLTGGIELIPFTDSKPQDSEIAISAHSTRKFYQEKPAYDMTKRIFDIVFSTLAIVALSPLMIAVAVMIVLEDLGSPIYTQDRVGRNGKVFRIYKFRSMYKNADKIRDQLKGLDECNGATFKIKNDPRITRIGHIIRKTSIDELPQLFNILKGEMSIIGPRPFIPKEQALLPEDRLLVNPGLSCYWQVGGKNSLSQEEQIALDRKYIKERSIAVDIKIIILTILFVFKSGNS